MLTLPYSLRSFRCLFALLAFFLAAPPPADDQKPLVDCFGDALPDGAVLRLGTLRLQTGNRAWAVAYAPDGKVVATAGEDHKVRVWEASTGKELHTFVCDAFVSAVAFVPGTAGKPCNLLASASHDKRVRLWDLTTGKCIEEFIHPEKVRNLAVTPDGRFLAAGVDHEIWLWDVSARKKMHHWAAHSGGVLSLAFTPDGKGLLSGGYAQEQMTGSMRMMLPRPPNDYALALWETHTGKMRKKFAAHNVMASVLGFTADGKTWATAGTGQNGSEIVLWNAALEPRQTISIKDLQERVDAFALAPDGKTVAAAGARGIQLWDVATGKHLPALTDGDGYLPLAIAFSPDSQTLAATAVMHRVHLWDLAKKTPRHSFAAHSLGLWTVAVAPGGKTAITGGADGDVREWDLATGKPLRQWRPQGSATPLISAAQFAADGKTLAVSYFWGVTLWDVASGKVLRDLPAPFGQGRINSLALSPGGGKLVWQSQDDGDLPLWDVKAGKEIRRLPQGTGGCYFLAYSPTDDVVASVVTNRLCLWNAKTGKAIYEKQLSGHYVAFSPDGLLLAIYSEPIRILEAATGAELAQIPWRKVHGGTWSLAFSPDGRYLAMTELENIGLWDVAAGKFVHTFGSHRYWTTSVAFTPDGKRLVSASTDTTALVWDMNRVSPAKLPAWDGPALWDDLKDADRQRAYSALYQLRQAPAETLALLRKTLEPIAAVDATQLKKLLADLEDTKFATRQAASEELAQLVDRVEGALRTHCEKTLSPEARTRLEVILVRAGQSPETRRLLWTLRLLEGLGTTEALALVQRLAGGAPEALVTRQAQETVGRWKKV